MKVRLETSIGEVKTAILVRTGLTASLLETMIDHSYDQVEDEVLPEDFKRMKGYRSVKVAEEDIGEIVAHSIEEVSEWQTYYAPNEYAFEVTTETLPSRRFLQTKAKEISDALIEAIDTAIERLIADDIENYRTVVAREAARRFTR